MKKTYPTGMTVRAITIDEKDERDLGSLDQTEFITGLEELPGCGVVQHRSYFQVTVGPVGLAGPVLDGRFGGRTAILIGMGRPVPVPPQLLQPMRPEPAQVLQPTSPSDQREQRHVTRPVPLHVGQRGKGPAMGFRSMTDFTRTAPARTLRPVASWSEKERRVGVASLVWLPLLRGVLKFSISFEWMVFLFRCSKLYSKLATQQILNGYFVMRIMYGNCI
ncbi:hypothetical protein Lal_00042438 [Lupinus albus]|nr:hypothetical protein Lal_00042438 [Lupinus albus]